MAEADRMAHSSTEMCNDVVNVSGYFADTSASDIGYIVESDKIGPMSYSSGSLETNSEGSCNPTRNCTIGNGNRMTKDSISPDKD